MERGSTQGQPGFTLIELMITVAVLAILAAIAIPNYTDYVRRGKLPEATSNLLAMKTKMEQWFQDNRTYPTTCGATVTATQIQVPTLQFFTITCPTLTATTYTIQATGGVAGGDQTVSGITFSIDQGNNRSTTVTASSLMDKAGFAGNANCWVTKKGGQC